MFTGAMARVRVEASARPGYWAAHSGGAPAQIEPARIGVSRVGRNTTLRLEGGGASAEVATVEHLLAALVGMGITAAEVWVEGPEVPILDGSAMMLVEKLHEAGRVAGAAPTPMTVTRGVRVEDGKGGWIEARPAAGDGWLRRYELEYPEGSGLKPQAAEWRGDVAEFVEGIAPARTFCLEREAVALREAGLFGHVTPREMVVIRPDGTALENALKWPDEPARHKLLDLVGDLALLGRPLRADVVAHRSGHALTHELCRRLTAEIAEA